MPQIFCGYLSLEEINLSNFKTDNITDISGIFYDCILLKQINLTNFNTNNVTNISYMFFGWSDELKNKIKEQNKNIFIYCY